MPTKKLKRCVPYSKCNTLSRNETIKYTLAYHSYRCLCKTIKEEKCRVRISYNNRKDTVEQIVEGFKFFLNKKNQ